MGGSPSRQANSSQQQSDSLTELRAAVKALGLPSTIQSSQYPLPFRGYDSSQPNAGVQNRGNNGSNGSDPWTALTDEETGLVFYWNSVTNEATALGAAKPSAAKEPNGSLGSIGSVESIY